jgi:E3 SUMO-protein ligase PIAS1
MSKWRLNSCSTLHILIYLFRYVRDILKNTPKSVDQVTVQPDGKWELHNRRESQPISKQNGVASDSDDSDIVEITKSGDSVRMSTYRASQTPVLGQLSRSSSTAARPSGSMSGSTSSKRPAAVIDLTSSGDEDEKPLARAPKRQQTNGFQPMSVPAYRPGPPNGVPPPRI